MENTNTNTNTTNIKILKCHIFDIESLWDIDQNVWIVDKNNPSVPLVKISESDFNLIESGVYKSQENLLRFNSKDFYIPDELMDELRVLSKKNEDMDINSLAFSMREYLDKDYINNLKFEILEENFTHLKNKVDDIYIISTKIVEEKYSKIIKKLEEKLNKKGLNIEKYYLTSKSINFNNEDKDIFTKGNVILKHSIGHNIKDSKFISEDVKKYDIINYYDSNSNIISNLIGNLQSQFEHLFYNSDDIIKKDILDNYNDNGNNEVMFNYITSNEINRFNKTELELKRPKNIMMYESFINILR